MAKNSVSPTLFDITADIAGEIPIELIKDWADSDLTPLSQEKFLAPYIIKGTVVCSDSAGLSKLSGERGLIEVMKLVNEPKEVIYAFGRGAGGKAVGTWFADNTEMIYSEDVKVDDLIMHLAAAQKEISELTVQVGMSVHTGEFIELGKGLYGPDANFAEALSENYTAGGEIAISQNVKNKTTLHKHFNLRDDLQMEHQVYSLDYSELNPKAHKIEDELYPIPFHEDFYRELQYDDFVQIEEKYTKDRIVVLIQVDHAEEDLLLNKLSNLALANYYLQKVVQNYPVTVIKSNGSLGIYIFEDVGPAVDFAKDIQQTLIQNQYASRIGVAKGEVLIFDLMSGGKEIAGNPVNIASKFAEDYGEDGYIYVHESVLNDGEISAELKRGAEPFVAEISHVTLKGWRI